MMGHRHVEQAALFYEFSLEGHIPSDLPVEQATEIEIFVNLKAAKALGVEVPTSILLRADEVIE